MESFVANQTNSQLNVNCGTNPSIFEVLAQQSLASGLRRAANYVTNILFTNNRQKFGFLYNNFDELYLLIDLFVQLCHLQAFNASFSEHFYSLKRVSNERQILGLNRKQFFSSLIVLTAFPYIKTKFDNLFKNLKLKQLDSQLNSDSKRFQQIFVKTYPIFCTFCQLMSLYYQISYTIGQNNYYSPLLRLSNVRLINSENNELQQKSSDFEIIESNNDWFRHFARLSLNLTKYLAKGFNAGLSFSAFFIQFLDYWYSSDTTPASFAPLPIPPPPEKFKLEIPLNSCPICLKVRQNDTALITSGFVFCYTCIANYLINNNRCPVTGYPSTVQHMIKIYPPDH